MAAVSIDPTAVRARFSSLAGGFAFLDAPGGSQVPDSVGDAIARCLREASANMGASYETSRRVGAIVAEAEVKAAAFLGCEPSEIIFGPNMTSLDFTLSRTAGREFAAGDEILVSSLDHDGGVAPWLELAHDKGLRVQHIELHDDTTLDYDDLAAKLTERTRVVAFAWASNAVGTIVDAARVCELAHSVGALAWVDAVHYAAHEPIDVGAIGADVLLCSPYKFCGPHLGIAYGRTSLLESWRPYKARPAPTSPLGRRFETGTLPYELSPASTRRSTTWRRSAAWRRRALRARPWRAVSRDAPDSVTVYGLPTLEGRVPTFLVNVAGVPAGEVATTLGERGIGVWAHNTWYSLNLYSRLGYDGDAIRIGFIHYNTAAEVDRLVGELAACGPS